MRTMLISLIVIFSLALVARADDPDTDSGGCGTIYDCYAPESCTDTAQRGKPFDQVKPVEVKGPIFNDCPAIIRFFQYNKYRVHVSIESLLDISKIASIELLQDHENDGNDLTKFSCLSNNGNMEGKFEQTPTEAPAPVMRTLKDVKDTSTNKLKCVFEVTRKGQNSFTGEQNDKVTFSISGTQVMTSQKSHRLQILRNVQCDPADLEFDIDDVHDEAKLYSEIKYSPGTYFCEHEKYSMEYRLYGQNKYSQVSEITCDNKKFKFDAKEIPKGSTIMIRCAIEIKFLCDYDVKEDAAGERPVKESGGGKATSLKCPEATPHLMVVENAEKKKPILNPNFVCEYFGGEPVWTVKSMTGKDQLTKEGPPVYCTNQLPCNELNPISDSTVYEGFVSQPDFLPKCHDRGVLWAGDSVVIGELKCNGMTGKYAYTEEVGKKEKVVDADTKFVCKYPIEPEVEEDKEKVEQIGEGIGYAAGGIVAAVLVLCTILGVWTFCNVRKERRKKEAENHAAFMKYCADSAELEAYQGGKKTEDASEPEQQQQYNEQTTEMRYECMAEIANEEGEFAIEKISKLVTLKKRPLKEMMIVKNETKPHEIPVGYAPRCLHEATIATVDEKTVIAEIQKYNAQRKYVVIDPKKPNTSEKKEKTQPSIPTGDVIKIVDTNTNRSLPKMRIRKVVSASPPSHNHILLDPSTHGEPVAQLHKCAFQVIDAEDELTYLWMSHDTIMLTHATRLPNSPLLLEVSDGAVWTIISVNTEEYRFFEAAGPTRYPITPAPRVTDVETVGPTDNERLDLTGSGFTHNLKVWLHTVELETVIRNEELASARLPPLKTMMMLCPGEQINNQKLPITIVRDDGVIYRTSMTYTYRGYGV